MADLIPYTVIMERVKDDIDYIAEQAYERGKRDILEQLQSAQPERPRGEWNIIKGTGLASCECGHITDRYSTYDFCPVCGADMRGDKE